MLTIENIKNLIGTKLRLGKYEIDCIDVSEINDEISTDGTNSYNIDFKLPVTTSVVLVLWLDRRKDLLTEGWKMSNNLADGESWIKPEDVESLKTFINSLQLYLDNCSLDITSQFIDDYAI